MASASAASSTSIKRCCGSWKTGRWEKRRDRRPDLHRADGGARELLLDWRTRPDIAGQMLTSVAYDVERQKAWLRRRDVSPP